MKVARNILNKIYIHFAFGIYMYTRFGFRYKLPTRERRLLPFEKLSPKPVKYDMIGNYFIQESNA